MNNTIRLTSADMLSLLLKMRGQDVSPHLFVYDINACAKELEERFDVVVSDEAVRIDDGETDIVFYRVLTFKTEADLLMFRLEMG